MRRAFLIAILGLFAVAAGGAAADGGPSPGVSFGWDGVTGRGGQLRYVALPARNRTLVEAIRTRDGRVLRWGEIAGSFGVPLVAYDGSAGGLSHDSKTLVLGSFTGPPTAHAVTRFAVLDVKELRLRDIVSLSGTFSYDALAPDASTMYLIQYTSAKNYNRYRVRAYDLAAGKLLPGAIVDKREPKEPMTGSPVTRVTAPDGSWVYTLYSRPGKKPFVHALDAAHRGAVCIDLDNWRGPQNNLSRLRLRLSSDGRQLLLSRRDGTRVLAVATPGSS
jgi:hypothetical protein